VSAPVQPSIHDKARQMQAQSPHPIELSECYRRLGRRGARPRKVPVDMSKVRMPYKD